MEVLSKLGQLAVDVGGKLVLALLIFIVGRIIIKYLIKGLSKIKKFDELDPTVHRFFTNAVKFILNAILVISIINVLGVPMASIVAVLASAGLAVGMALQGSLSNMAGGIMLLIFRPFNVDDYVSAAGEDGFVKKIALFYTELLTIDNRTVIIPNGPLMNGNIINFTKQGKRRVDLVFTTAKSEEPQKVQDIMKAVMEANEKVISDPAAPFAQVSGGTNEAMQFTVRAWCETADYWDVYFGLIQGIVEALGAAGVQAPAVRVINEIKQ
ncbi:MAG: mechanosensitive ion channel [Firmicutes bacterium]|nr:mechanosensitive ion channel [Bacillota bacterium]